MVLVLVEYTVLIKILLVLVRVAPSQGECIRASTLTGSSDTEVIYKARSLYKTRGSPDRGVAIVD